MYDLHSAFDIKQHKAHYINYLEVVIFPDGHIEYAIPSHQEKLMQICQDKLGVSRYGLEHMCPREYYGDFMTWLCNISGCVSVWNNYIIKSNTVPMTIYQKKTIEKLIDEQLLQLRGEYVV